MAYQCFQSKSELMIILCISETTVHQALGDRIELNGLRSWCFCQVLVVRHNSIVSLYNKLDGGFMKF